MFFFGSPEDTRDLYLSNSLALKGPNLPSTSFDELNGEQQKILFAYIYLAYSDALRDNISGDNLSAILELYDATFLSMVQSHSDFREAVKRGAHVYLPDYSDEVKEKYQQMASSLQRP